jgi:hypothetical protein
MRQNSAVRRQGQGKNVRGSIRFWNERVRRVKRSPICPSTVARAAPQARLLADAADRRPCAGEVRDVARISGAMTDPEAPVHRRGVSCAEHRRVASMISLVRSVLVVAALVLPQRAGPPNRRRHLCGRRPRSRSWRSQAASSPTKACSTPMGMSAFGIRTGSEPLPDGALACPGAGHCGRHPRIRSRLPAGEADREAGCSPSASSTARSIRRGPT